MNQKNYMKTALRSILFISLLALNMGKSNAQCSASDIFIQNIVSSGAPAPGTCSATFDLSFTMTNNNGNKYIFLHIWRQTLYPDFFTCVNGAPSGHGAIQPPLGPDLIDAFINIGINNNGPVPVILTTYNPDPSVTMNTVSSITSTVLSDGSVSFTLHGVAATFPTACNTAFVMVADFWSSQSASASVAHCVSCNRAFAINFMSVTGLVSCANYNVNITNQIGTAHNGFYQVYADVNHDGVLTTNIDSLLRDTTNFTLGAGVGTIYPFSGPIPNVNIGQDILIYIKITSGLGAGSRVITRLTAPFCAPLPVTFKTFNATRLNMTTVALRWETASEINNSGFAIQRNMGNNNWELVTFINTQAPGGNSSTPVNYTFNDMNTNKGITQYRIKQVDLEGKAKFSEIRAVRGNEQKAKIIVYPNPSTDGRVNIVFDNQEGTRDVTISDMSGRTIQQWKGVSNNTIQVENLGSGMYILRVVIKETGNQSVEKIIVAKY